MTDKTIVTDTMPNSVVEALNKRAFDIAMQEATPADARDVIEDLTKALATLSQQPAQTDVHQGERDKALEELVNDTIDDWHEDPHTDLTLPERLGWSDEEYSRWVETGELPPMLAALKGATQ